MMRIMVVMLNQQGYQPLREQCLSLVAQAIKEKQKGDNKELMIVPGAVHTDLYDRTDIIPFDKIESFLKEYLK